jgi:hypothetical protein
MTVFINGSRGGGQKILMNISKGCDAFFMARARVNKFGLMESNFYVVLVV